MDNPIVVGDADALIALALEKDPNHVRAQKIAKSLRRSLATVIFPVTVFPEAITSLKRAAKQPEKAHLINRQYLAGAFHVEYIGEEVMRRAAEIFDQKANSKQNTLFDAIVASTSEKLNADGIFSFDNWYPKLGLNLVEE